MKLTGKSFRGPNAVVHDAAEAVQFVTVKCAMNYEGHAQRVAARADALEGVLGRLMDKLIANGVLRAEQVSEIFNYDVIAEDD